ncbi:lipopolysaccharide biosynthesis protein [Methylobacterium nodulans]|uniref:Polysaccharide biosynthesis protein n=1 Tax=Methylobacterium nodulans (strain LMG 21967 / CNCM I-2342 / ORS 2060) TaxID=460265 RepID=B8IHE9_METNO|nr:oligosaccharide flippase family protein [Methylobacterium nodulans]ACL61612.1 polysaccharide biosynthesis protein [Methylobacterium nodulans ORS 2060]
MFVGFTESIGRLFRPFRKSTTLVQNSGAMAIGSMVTAVLGFAYWWLAARLFPPEVVGTATALLSIMGLLGLLGEAGLGTLLMGEIARHPSRMPGLVAAACSVGGLMSICLASLYLITAYLLMGSERLIHGWTSGIVFVLGTGLSGLSILTDQAFIGMLRTTSGMIRQTLFAIFKLGFLLLAISTPSALTILLSWAAGMFVSWIGLDLIVRGEARRLLVQPDFRLLYHLRSKAWAHYCLDVALQAPSIGMPYLVLVLLSPTINAPFAAIWMLVSVVNIIPAALATVLFPAVRADPGQSRHQVGLSLALSSVFSLGCGVLLYFATETLLGLFNPAYPALAGTGLDWLGFSLIGWTMKMHACTIARLSDSMAKVSRWFALGGLLEVGAAALGAQYGALHGLVAGWTAAITVVGAVVLARSVVVARAKRSSPGLGDGACPTRA